MITQFKIFENDNQYTILVINDLIDYYTNDKDIVDASLIYDFIEQLMKFKRVIEFQCLHCTQDVNGITNYFHTNKKHKGKVRGYGYGLQLVDTENVILNVSLDRIKYKHEVDTNKPMIIYGELEEHLKDVIDEINMNNNIEKYNL